MGVSTNTRKAYSEIDEFLGLLSIEQVNKIPVKLRKLLKKEKEQQYKKNINPNISIKEQGLLEETLAIIALLNLKYWCENNEEKERLKKIYAKNEKTYQEYLQAAFNSNDIFKKALNLENQQQKTENTQMVEYKESFIKKIIDKIKRIFLR